MKDELKMFSYDGLKKTPKNRLEKAVLEFLSLNSRRIIHREDGVEHFKNQICQGIDMLNAKFTRCGKYHAWWVPLNNGDWMLYGEVCNFRLYKIVNE